MTKLIDLIRNYRPSLKGKLKKQIKVVVCPTTQQKKILRKGTVSDILIPKGDGTYHFEANNIAITVTADEIEIL